MCHDLGISRRTAVVLAGCGTMAFLAGLAGLAPVIAVVDITRRLVSGDTAIWPAVVVAVVAVGFRIMAVMAAAVLAHLADIDVSFTIRRALIDRIQKFPLRWFTARNSGGIKKAVEDDVSSLHHLIAHATVDVPMAVAGPVGGLAYLAVVDWRFALVTLAPLTVGMVSYRRAMAGAEGQYREYEGWLGKLNSATVEFVNGIGVVKAFGGGVRALREFTGVAKSFGEFYRQWSASTGMAAALSEVALSPLSVMATTAVGGLALVGYAGADPIVMIAALAVSGLITGGVAVVLLSLHQLHNAAEAGQRIRELIGQPVLPAPMSPIAPGDSAIEIDSVVVDTEGHRILDGVTVSIPAGTVTALVGVSGAGKSTLASLIPRFTDPDEGAVRIGGVDVRDIDTAQLYRHVSFVFQDSTVFTASIAENIALARPDATPDEIRAAASAAQLLDRIEELPHGFGTTVNTEVRLSGGERQRVCIARALLADAPIMVLDEPTSSADPDSEARIQEAVSALCVGRTVVVVAHRLTTVAGVDQIVVLDRGRVAESGTHGALLAADGLYRRLWEADAASAVIAR